MGDQVPPPLAPLVFAVRCATFIAEHGEYLLELADDHDPTMAAKLRVLLNIQPTGAEPERPPEPQPKSEVCGARCRCPWGVPCSLEKGHAGKCNMHHGRSPAGH